MPEDFSKKLETKKSASTLQLLMKSARVINEWGISRANQKRSPGHRLRPSHLSLMPHLDLEGTRVTTLAERLGISKQAVAQLVEEMETMGYLKRHPDPRDGRAKLVRFTKKGERSLLDGLDLLKALETEIAQELGHSEMRKLHRLLGLTLEIAKKNTSSSTM